jgi:Protein of unknown function (DUF3089)
MTRTVRRRWRLWRSRPSVRSWGFWLLASFAASLAFASTSTAKTVWLCKASRGPCGKSLTTTVVETDGSTSVEKAKKPHKPPINCFYVYPTVSEQTTANANLEIEKNETAVAEGQASRFSQDCRVYAPMYEQITLRALLEPSIITPEVEARAYAGVLAAWEEFLAKYDKGKGVVLIGHSQGSLMLIQLIKEQIDPSPTERKLLVSALLLGGNVLVHEGELVGGEFQNVPACQEATETGCVIAYSSFLKEPPIRTIFGRPESSLIKTPPPLESEVLCVNPTLEVQDGTAGPLLPYESTKPAVGELGHFYGAAPTAKTPWVSSPGEYTAQCHKENGASWLQVNPVGTAVDPPEYVQELLGPEWGLHLFDVNIALGNLVKTVATEATSYTP